MEANRHCSKKETSKGMLLQMPRKSERNDTGMLSLLFPMNLMLVGGRAVKIKQGSSRKFTGNSSNSGNIPFILNFPYIFVILSKAHVFRWGRLSMSKRSLF